MAGDLLHGRRDVGMLGELGDHRFDRPLDVVFQLGVFGQGALCDHQAHHWPYPSNSQVAAGLAVPREVLDIGNCGR